MVRGRAGDSPQTPNLQTRTSRPRTPTSQAQALNRKPRLHLQVPSRGLPLVVRGRTSDSRHPSTLIANGYPVLRRFPAGDYPAWCVDALATVGIPKP